MSVPRWLAPPPPAPPLDPAVAERRRRRLRLQILEATFLGYATFYLVRNNLGAVARDLAHTYRYDNDQLGNILALTAITYGLGKLILGALSDRSNVRVFMPLGLLLTALCNFAFGAAESYPVHLALWGLNGFFQGAGWAPCGRSLGHWFSVEERGSVFAVWNIAHNVGGGLAGMIAAFAAGHLGLASAFYIPGLIALIGAAYLLWRLRDTPESEGLGATLEHAPERELELSFLLRLVLKNRMLWLFAVANLFVYFVRYSMLDWGPLYLREVKGASIEKGGLAVLLLEFGGIPSTLLIGWLSDRFDGRRGMLSLVCLVPITLAFTGIVLNPPGRLWLDLALLGVVGFFVYPPVMLLGVAALDLTSKKAVGAAAGFVGLFGYLGRTLQAKGLGALTAWATPAWGARAAWELALWTIVLSALFAMALLAFTWRVRPRS